MTMKNILYQSARIPASGDMLSEQIIVTEEHNVILLWACLFDDAQESWEYIIEAHYPFYHRNLAIENAVRRFDKRSSERRKMIDARHAEMRG